MRTSLLSMLALVLAVHALSGCAPRDSDGERSSESPDLVDAQKYLPNAPSGSLIHMPLTGAVAQFYERNGRLPANFDELVKAGFIKEVPQPPAGTRYGHKATLVVGGSGERVELLPEKEFAGEVDAEIFTKLPAEDVREHEKNWFDCIRSGNQPNANIELAVRVQTVLSLAEMSDRLKITCLFDETTRKVIDGLGQEIAPLTYDNA